jgi:prevent-host-death family protein
MKTVGVRELKNRLSEYLREVRSGEAVLVTDRGQVVAELTPPGLVGATDTAVPAGLMALAKRGMATLAVPADGLTRYPALPRPRRGKYTATELLDQERGSR